MAAGQEQRQRGSNPNAKWQMIFGIILVVAVILAVVVMVTVRPDGLDNPGTSGQGTITAPTPSPTPSEETWSYPSAGATSQILETLPADDWVRGE